MAGDLFVSPKTHTPGPQVKKRGQRLYSPGMGRWVNRDPVIEDYLRLQEWFSRAGYAATFAATKNTFNLYHFVYNNSIGLADGLGKDPEHGNQLPKEGDQCCVGACDLTAGFERTGISPMLTGGGCSRRRAVGWNINVKVNYTVNGGVCHILGCKYWTCNTGWSRSNADAWIPGGCGEWTYSMRGDPDRFPNDGYHAKAMAGKIEYLSCENRVWTKKTIDAGDLAFGLYYDPPEAYSGGPRIYPTGEGGCR